MTTHSQGPATYTLVMVVLRACASWNGGSVLQFPDGCGRTEFPQLGGNYRSRAISWPAFTAGRADGTRRRRGNLPWAKQKAPPADLRAGLLSLRSSVIGCGDSQPPLPNSSSMAVRLATNESIGGGGFGSRAQIGGRNHRKFCLKINV